MTVFSHTQSSAPKPSWETIFINAHATLFQLNEQEPCEQLYADFDRMVDTLAEDIYFDKYAKVTAELTRAGEFAAISNIAALFEYGAPKANLRLAYENARAIKGTLSKCELLPLEHQIPSFITSRSSSLASKILQVGLNRESDRNVYPLVHIYLVFIHSLITAQESWRAFEKDPAWRSIETSFPWYSICRFLNTLPREDYSTSDIFAEDFPLSNQEYENSPLPEDFALRGQIYSQGYFPNTWFTDSMVEDDERTLELPCTTQARMKRILWLGHRIASVCHTPVK